MHEWLEEASARLAGAAAEDTTSYRLTAEEREDLLDLARVASQESGDRTNAPLVCYLVGLARGRSGADLATLVDEVVGKRV